jgi:hypothetical protein
MQQYIAYGLIVAGALWTIFRFVKDKCSVGTLSIRSDIPRILGTDETAPTGTMDYLKMIEFEAPKATEKEWWVYAKQGLSMVAVVRSERDRLGGGPA